MLVTHDICENPKSISTGSPEVSLNSGIHLLICFFVFVH